MKLVKYENYQVVPTEEAMFIKPLRDMYNKDKSKNKENFMQTVSFIYHYCDPRSSYADIFDDEMRKQAILEQEGIEDFKITDKIEEAINAYKNAITTTTQKLLNSMRKSITKIADFLENVDLTLLDDKGKPVYTVSSVVQATDKIPQLTKKLIETEKIVAAEIEESNKMRGGEERAHAFEGGF